MDTFDLKTALNLLPVMTDDQTSIKQLIDNIDYYGSLLKNSDCQQNLINFVLKSRLSQSAKIKLQNNYTNIASLLQDMRTVWVRLRPFEPIAQKGATAIQTKMQQIRQDDRSISEFGRELSELFVDLTISQANGNSESFSVLKPLNEKTAIKKFADGLRNRRISTIIAARNFTSLKDAIQAAVDEEVSSPGTSGQVLNMNTNSHRNYNFRNRGNYYQGRSYNTRSFHRGHSFNSRGRPPHMQPEQSSRGHYWNRGTSRSSHAAGRGRGRYPGKSYYNNNNFTGRGRRNNINFMENTQSTTAEKPENLNQFFRD